jgi:hypothetical protein
VVSKARRRQRLVQKTTATAPLSWEVSQGEVAEASRAGSGTDEAMEAELTMLWMQRMEQKWIVDGDGKKGEVRAMAGSRFIDCASNDQVARELP